MEKSKKVQQLIEAFEAGNISSETALSEINTISNIEVDLSWLCSYNSSIDLETFVRILTIDPIIDWKEIDDKRAIIILNEILDSLSDDAVIQRNFEALEKRYFKSTGTISDWIFQDDINDPKELLRLLKTNSSIIL